jgi:hypothetical protein
VQSSIKVQLQNRISFPRHVLVAPMTCMCVTRAPFRGWDLHDGGRVLGGGAVNR